MTPINFQQSGGRAGELSTRGVKLESLGEAGLGSQCSTVQGAQDHRCNLETRSSEWAPGPSRFSSGGPARRALAVATHKQDCATGLANWYPPPRFPGIRDEDGIETHVVPTAQKKKRGASHQCRTHRAPTAELEKKRGSHVTESKLTRLAQLRL